MQQEKKVVTQRVQLLGRMDPRRLGVPLEAGGILGRRGSPWGVEGGRGRGVGAGGQNGADVGELEEERTEPCDRGVGGWRGAVANVHRVKISADSSNAVPPTNAASPVAAVGGGGVLLW